MSIRSLRRNRTVAWVGGVIATLGVSAFVLRLVESTRGGRGLTPYTSGRGVEVTPIQVLTTIAFLAGLAIVVGGVILFRKWHSKSP